MKTIEIAWKNFELQEIAHNFLENYLERVSSYVKKNDIDSELYQDILQGLSDKLSTIENKWHQISEKDCINIINQIWEPEDIFGEDAIEEETTTKKNSTKKGNNKFFEELQENGRERDMSWAIVLWISGVLGEKRHIPTNIIRLIFLILIPFYSFSIWIYIILGIILPIKGKNYSWKSTIGYIKTQIRDLRLGILKWFQNGFVVLRKFLSRTWKVFGKVIIFCIIFFIGIWFLMTIFWLLFMAGWLLVGVNYNNIIFTSMFPWYTFLWCVIGIYSATVFVLLIVQQYLKEKLVTYHFIVSAIIGCIVSTFLFIMTGYHIMNNFSEHFSATQSIEIPVKANQDKVILNLEFLNDIHIHGFDNGSSQIYFYQSTGNTIKIETENTIWTKDKTTANNIFTNFSKQNIVQDGQITTINTEDNKPFKIKTPFAPIKQIIHIYVPTNIQIKIINNQYNHINNVQRSAKQEKYGHFLGYRNMCEWAYIWYSTSESGFICESDFSDNSYIVKRYIESKLPEQADDISPLKVAMYDDNDWTYWNVHSFNRIDSDTVTMKIYDQYLNIFIQLKVKELDDGVSVLSSKVTQVEQKMKIRKDQYKNIEIFDKYKLSFEEDNE